LRREEKRRAEKRRGRKEMKEGRKEGDEGRKEGWTDGGRRKFMYSWDVKRICYALKNDRKESFQ
jgi:hypothetical protein